MQPLKSALPIAIIMAISTTPNAIAQDFYAEGTVGLSGFDFDALDSDDYTMLGVRFGRNFTSNLAIEGEYAVGVSETNRTIASFDPINEQSYSIDASSKLDSTYGVFGKAMVPIGNGLTVHARVGYATTEFESNSTITYEDGTTENRAFNDTDPSLAYGLGAEFNFSEQLYARADATRLETFGTDVEAYTLGVGFRF